MRMAALIRPIIRLPQGPLFRLFATGLGQTTPAELDGVTNSNDPAPANLAVLGHHFGTSG